MNKDVVRLRELALRIKEISLLPIQETRRKQWQKMNDLQMEKPMVYTRDYPWEMVITGDELLTTIEDEFLRSLEFQMLCTLFKWEHIQTDMIIDPTIYCTAEIKNLEPIKYKISSSGYVEADKTARRNNFSKTAEQYIRRIFTEDDIDNVLPMPQISFDKVKLDNELEKASEIFEGILNVEKNVMPAIDYTPWDDLIKLFGIQEGLMELYLNPELMHKAMERYTDVYIELLHQYERAGLWISNNGNMLVGTGALGFTNDLPQRIGMGVNASESWGFCADQIFTSVSPQLHDEFATQHEIRWMEQFALTYYGCCERLDNKIELLKKFKNLRKISISSFSDKEKAMEIIGKSHVVSYKPNSTLLATVPWDMEASKKEILDVCRLAEKYGCNLEIIMKTMITLNDQPNNVA